MLVVLLLCPTDSLNLEFVCSVLVVADQLLITRLKEICEVVITENCMFYFDPCPLTNVFSSTLISHQLYSFGQNAKLVETIVVIVLKVKSNVINVIISKLI